MVFSIIQKSKLEGARRLDAEYYQPEYLGNSTKIEKFGFYTLQDLSVIDITKGETPLWRGDEYIAKGTPFLRSENLFASGLNLSNLVFISDKVHGRMKRSRIYPNDVLVAIVGATIGQTGLVAEEYPEYNSNQAIAIIRPQNQKIAHFLSIILETKICQLQIERLKGGGARDNLDLHEVKVIKIPKPNDKILNYCDRIVGGVKELRKQGESSCSQAENFLLEEVGPENFKRVDDLSSIVNLSETKVVNRMDAEYFQPKYKKLVEHIKKHGNGVLLGNLVTIKKGIEPGAEAYQEAGKQFIRVSSLSKNGVSDSEQKYLNEDLYKKLKDDYEPKKGEILLTKDATPGIAYVLKEDIEGIVSGGILRLSLKKKDVEIEYLALCLNSIVGQMQAERDAGGSVIAHWKPEQIKKIIIPLLPQSTQQKISDLVRQSHEARKKAKELLEEARQKVEEMIERGGE